MTAYVVSGLGEAAQSYPLHSQQVLDHGRDYLQTQLAQHPSMIQMCIRDSISMQSLQKWISQAALNTTASALFVQTAAAAGIGFVITMFFAPILVAEFSVAGACCTLPWVRVAFARYRRLLSLIHI